MESFENWGGQRKGGLGHLGNIQRALGSQLVVKMVMSATYLFSPGLLSVNVMKG